MQIMISCLCGGKCRPVVVTIADRNLHTISTLICSRAVLHESMVRVEQAVPGSDDTDPDYLMYAVGNDGGQIIQAKLYGPLSADDVVDAGEIWYRLWALISAQAGTVRFRVIPHQRDDLAAHLNEG